MAEQKIAIIGRGLAGLTLAFRMVEAGLRPTIFGQSQGPGNASRCAQGIVCNKGLIFAESPLFRAKLQTLKKLEAWLSQLERASGLTIPRIWIGVDEPYWDEADFQKTVERVYRRNFWGCYRPENRSVETWLPEFKTPEGYLHYPDDAWFDVGATLNALEKACEKAGSVLIDEPLTDIRKQTAGFDHITIAAGANSIRLLEDLGLSCPKYFHVAGQSLSWRHPPQEKAQILVKGTLSLAVLPDRKILGSSSWKPVPDQSPDLAADREQLLAQMKSTFGLDLTDFDRAGIQSNWGTRLRFGDRMPALGIWPDEDLQQRYSVLTGFYKNGLQLADLCAEQLFCELSGQPLSEFGEAFHIQRFFKTGRRAAGSPPRSCPLSIKTQNPH